MKPITCQVLEERNYPLWDDYVSRCPDASVYHLSAWGGIIKRVFGKRWYVIAAFSENRLCGGLPLVHMESWLFGNFLISMPYFNYGGVLGDSPTVTQSILDAAITLGRDLGCRHIELRHLKNHYDNMLLRNDKVSMWLNLPRSAEELWEAFSSKLRSQIRKGKKNALVVQVGGQECLEDFYEIFSQNMRYLGTPVYSRAFFKLILEEFSNTVRIMIIRRSDGAAIASGFLIGYRNRLEIPWASSLREYNHLQANMFLYWHCLKYACDQGYKIFDFGRSTRKSSTYRFKEQWGAKPVSHFWHYHLNGCQGLPQFNPQNPNFRFAIACWRKLPLSVTQFLGPVIVRHLP